MSTLPQSTARPRPTGGLAGIFEPTLSGMARRRAALGYLFLLPTILGLLIFTAGPVLVSLGLSLYDWDVIDPASFVGLANYQEMLTDSRVVVSFRNTLVFVVIVVILQLTIALALALGVQQKMAPWLRYYFRSAFFIPLLASAAAISIVLGYMFHREFGVINYYLGLIGIPRLPWLNASGWTLLSCALAYVWQNLGFSFIVFLGGLANISQDIHDAADVDGAFGLTRLWNVILPLLSPSLLFAATTSIIGALQVFEQPYVMTKGGPGDSSRTVVMTIYESAFKNLDIGYGSAIAMLLFLLILALTILQFEVSKRWVFYQ